MLGYPYEYEYEKKRIYGEAIRNGPGPYIMGQDYRKCELSEATHQFIDSLAGVEFSKRKSGDIVRPEIFKWLKKQLSRCEGIGEFVNKFLAHPATPKSRDYRNPPELDVTLGQILEAHGIICQIAIFISVKMGISSEGRSIGDVLAVPQFDQFIHFDKAWASEKTVEKLHRFWSGYDMQTRSWHNWVWEDDFDRFLHENL